MTNKEQEALNKLEDWIAEASFHAAALQVERSEYPQDSKQYEAITDELLRFAESLNYFLAYPAVLDT